MSKRCPVCGLERHDPQCPEMYFKTDGKPDKAKPRGVIWPGSLPPLKPLQGGR